MVQKIFLFGDKDGIFFSFLMEEQKSPRSEWLFKTYFVVKANAYVGRL